jgi:spermidine/putrescine transport system substrate-binding protein
MSIATMTRAQLLRGAAAGVAGVYLAGCGSSGGSASTGGASADATLNWLTWASHYTPEMLKGVKREGLTLNPSLLDDDVQIAQRLKAPGSAIDVVSPDALWTPPLVQQGLLESFDLGEVKVADQLYSVAREFDFWQDGGQYMSYPMSWASTVIIYDPAHASPAPDSWQALTDAKYRNRIVANKGSTELIAIGGVATSANEPFKMNDDEIARAKDYLKALKPNILTQVSQANELTRALIDGSVWIAIAPAAGVALDVKKNGGPAVKTVTPSEGTIGFIDGQCKVAASPNKDQFTRFLDDAMTAEWAASVFAANKTALFNEKAYRLIVDAGMQEEADAVLYGRPEVAAQVTLKGPSGNEQAYVDAYNEVFGA